MQWELRDLQRRVGITFVMVTHDQYEAMSMSDRIGVMFDGQLHQVASPSSLYAAPCNRRVAAFIGGMNFFDGTVSAGTVAVAGATVPVPRDWVDGPCTLGIRPEQLQLDDSVRDDWDLAVRGTVRDCSFYGESVHYRVDVAGSDHPWTVAQTNYFGRRDHAPGDSVYVGCQQAALINLGND